MTDTDENFRQACIKRAEIAFGTYDIAFDNDAQIFVGEDGVWVQAWVFLANDTTDDSEDSE